MLKGLRDTHFQDSRFRDWTLFKALLKNIFSIDKANKWYPTFFGTEEVYVKLDIKQVHYFFTFTKYAIIFLSFSSQDTIGQQSFEASRKNQAVGINQTYAALTPLPSSTPVTWFEVWTHDLSNVSHLWYWLDHSFCNPCQHLKNHTLLWKR
jgi:hypothetical protein